MHSIADVLPGGYFTWWAGDRKADDPIVGWPQMTQVGSFYYLGHLRLNKLLICTLIKLLPSLNGRELDQKKFHWEVGNFFAKWKLKSVYAFGLSVCLSVCARSNSRKYSSNVLKFKYVTHVWYSMDRIENGIYGTHGSSTETHKFFWCITANGGGNI